MARQLPRTWCLTPQEATMRGLSLDVNKHSALMMKHLESRMGRGLKENPRVFCG